MIRATVLVSLLALAGLSVPAQAKPPDIKCKLRFSASGWSVIYKTAKGTGVVTCSNGTSLPVRISMKGGGLTAGKSTLQGTGVFSDVHSAREVLGSYVTAEAHAGAVKSSDAQVLTKGEVSLALAATGRGWDLGIAFGAFHIDPR
ncbi:hypothetical protein [Pseudoxanthomonas spadix]|nr:hypothetical protein [Pseudoxanthomonas spadix]MBP3974018.1 hypothetical protein [Pseudoxanthomonas spadix]RMW95349.1 hypothetical protein D9R12_09740 [Pseudoxanthomonas spadix]